jgi:hypothetical protein
MSKKRARPFDIEWARSVIAQCKAAGVACFVKQFGACPYDGWKSSPVRCSGNGPDGSTQVECWMNLKDRKGGDMSEWPEWARVREFPL